MSPALYLFFSKELLAPNSAWMFIFHSNENVKIKPGYFNSFYLLHWEQQNYIKRKILLFKNPWPSREIWFSTVESSRCFILKVASLWYCGDCTKIFWSLQHWANRKLGMLGLKYLIVINGETKVQHVGY